ncbi:2Fe-2S iron-sulfur cluster-binding protein [Thalassotalea nanhaiensis]|uniref:2Fe-2S iron-sulfur cluster-binding protein n=1 Tax=Thalassotalea nanhaiensis TaxID=3065648 RepID=A0ABY9TIU4_9GAMM|nr:2Fe-2S iron-sulfur cluster-binding protein [Colwelliaceae bacterium SQ345]
MPFIRKIHKWASVIVGIQLLLWLISGIFFNTMDHTKAAGNTYKNRKHQHIEVEQSLLVEPLVVLQANKSSISLTQTHLLGEPYYLLTHAKGLYKHFKNHYSLVNAYTGEQLVIEQRLATALAKQSYTGPGDVVSVELLHHSIEDIPKQKNATWQINFSDEINTSVYIEAGSGRVVGHSDDDKRFADFFFMLHFMDYGNEGSFNSVQMMLFAFITLWLSLTGLIWTVDLGLRGQYKIKALASEKNVKLFDKDRNSMGNVTLSTHSNLLDGLIEHDIALPSSCGGGGTCGRCRILVNPSVEVTSADHQHFTDTQLQQGYRLACQHFSNDVNSMTLVDVSRAQKLALKLVKSSFISPMIKELRFKVIDGSKVKYKAGAFVRFMIPATKGCSIPLNIPEEHKPHWQHIEHLEYEHLACTRNYSLAESTLTTDELVFTIKIQTAPNKQILPGVASSYLCNLNVGKSVEAIGPFEDFHAKENSSKTMVFLGAGSGMAPLRSLIIEQLALAKDDQQPPRALHFFYGARKQTDLLYADDFSQWAKDNDDFFYYPTLSQPDESWHGAVGHAQNTLKSKLTALGNIDNIEFYLCGPPALMNDAIEFLISSGVDESNIAFDSFA